MKKMIFLLCLSLSSFSFAASACKGLSKSDCLAKKCVWVDAYMRKDGAKVSAYCRKAPAQKKNTSTKRQKSTESSKRDKPKMSTQRDKS